MEATSDLAVQNTTNLGEDASPERILLAGRTGSGKTAQIWTLPGKKFAYIFDPNSIATLRGLDLDYLEFYPDFLEMDATLKGFNKGSRDDKSPSKREPTLYLRWVEDINRRVEAGFFDEYDWLILDSLTFLSKAVMDRQLYINNRYGSVEDISDYRVVGSKLADMFGSIAGLPLGVYATGHIDTFQDDKTNKIETQLRLPGKARNILPLLFTNIWFAEYGGEGDKGPTYTIRTQPDKRGLQDIRTSIKGLKTVEDVTIDFDKDPARQGIGALLNRASRVRS